MLVEDAQETILILVRVKEGNLGVLRLYRVLLEVHQLLSGTSTREAVVTLELQEVLRWLFIEDAEVNLLLDHVKL